MAYYDNYRKDEDYAKLMDEAAAKGDFESAAVYEAQRNAKIGGENLNYAKTNKYQDYLPGNSVQLTDYTKFNKQADQFDTMISQLMDQINNRQPFSYDPETDPMYQIYKQQYTDNAGRSMKDTLAEVSARTGGLASSYAEQAAQGAYDEQMRQLDAVIPELRNLAYEMYQGDLNRDLNMLGVYKGLSDDAYGRAGDAYARKINEENTAYSRSAKEKADAQDLLEKYIGAGIGTANLPQELVELSGYDPAYLSALENQYNLKMMGGSGGSGRGTGGGGGTPTGGNGKWDDVDAWVDQYGSDAAEQYIKEHYRALGYKTASEALAGYQNHRLEAGIFDSTYDELYALADRAGLDAKPLTEEMFDKYYAGSAKNYDEYLQNWRKQMLGGDDSGNDNGNGGGFKDSRQYQKVMSQIDSGSYSLSNIQKLIENADVDDATREYLYKHALEKYS